MIEVGARLAGGRKAIMAQQTIPNWHPFDAMVVSISMDNPECCFGEPHLTRCIVSNSLGCSLWIPSPHASILQT